MDRVYVLYFTAVDGQSICIVFYSCSWTECLYFTTVDGQNVLYMYFTAVDGQSVLNFTAVDGQIVLYFTAVDGQNVLYFTVINENSCCCTPYIFVLQLTLTLSKANGPSSVMLLADPNCRTSLYAYTEKDKPVD